MAGLEARSTSGEIGDNIHMALSDEDKQWIKAELERVETNLLTAFHQWASPMEMRQRSHTAAIRALDEEMEALNDRVKKLEPPAA